MCHLPAGQTNCDVLGEGALLSLSLQASAEVLRWLVQVDYTGLPKITFRFDWDPAPVLAGNFRLHIIDATNTCGEGAIVTDMRKPGVALPVHTVCMGKDISTRQTRSFVICSRAPAPSEVKLASC